MKTLVIPSSILFTFCALLMGTITYRDHSGDPFAWAFLVAAYLLMFGVWATERSLLHTPDLNKKTGTSVRIMAAGSALAIFIAYFAGAVGVHGIRLPH